MTGLIEKYKNHSAWLVEEFLPNGHLIKTHGPMDLGDALALYKRNNHDPWDLEIQRQARNAVAKEHPEAANIPLAEPILSPNTFKLKGPVGVSFNIRANTLVNMPDAVQVWSVPSSEAQQRRDQEARGYFHRHLGTTAAQMREKCIVEKNRHEPVWHVLVTKGDTVSILKNLDLNTALKTIRLLRDDPWDDLIRDDVCAIVGIDNPYERVDDCPDTFAELITPDGVTVVETSMEPATENFVVIWPKPENYNERHDLAFKIISAERRRRE